MQLARGVFDSFMESIDEGRPAVSFRSTTCAARRGTMAEEKSPAPCVTIPINRVADGGGHGCMAVPNLPRLLNDVHPVTAAWDITAAIEGNAMVWTNAE